MILRRCLTWGGAILAIAPLLLAATRPAVGQDTEAGVGRGVYARECASCHGDAATGYGPASHVLREPPPDLTMLESWQQPFDRKRIRDLVSGHMRRVPAQWPSEMPYWRQSLDAEFDALLSYLESVQVRRYGPSTGITTDDQARMGAPVFRTFCASCHGEDGRGPQPSTYVVGIAPPDLTLIAVRSGGSVDMPRLYESIARCGDVGPEMPSWDRAFRSMGWSPVLSRMHLEDIAWYVESIQRR